MEYTFHEINGDNTPGSQQENEFLHLARTEFSLPVDRYYPGRYARIELCKRWAEEKKNDFDKLRTTIDSYKIELQEDQEKLEKERANENKNQKIQSLQNAIYSDQDIIDIYSFYIKKLEK